MLPALIPLAIGAGTAIAGAYGSYKQAQSDKANQEALLARQQAAIGDYNRSMAGLIPQHALEQQNALDKFSQDAQNYMNSPDRVAQWLNPNMDYQLAQVANMNNQQYAADGKMNSGAAMKSLQDRSQNLARMSWNDAFNQMNASNNQGLGHVTNLAGLKLDNNANIFNAKAGMNQNELNASLGLASPNPVNGFNAGMQGFTSGLNAGANIINAFRSSQK
ncbi:MAG: hypothetical protein LBC64_08050 [Fibromonadaceae bacterium]|jgi:hypothetical protein|nr:hypothetical protein [Fibromonadaceae bacterium]